MILLVKLCLTPLLIVLVSLAARRWGYAVAGWLSGLPTTSAPISLVLTLQHGSAFGARAALGTLGGLAASMVFCTAYALASLRLGWIGSLVAGFAAYGVTVLGLHSLTFGLAGTLACTLGSVVLGLVLVPRRSRAPTAPSPWWDLPARVGVALALVLALTGLSDVLGPSLSGLLSPFPVFTSILATIGRLEAGREGAVGFVRGVLLGAFSFIVFFAVLVTRLAHDGLVAYLLACAAALVTSGTMYAALGAVRGERVVPVAIPEEG